MQEPQDGFWDELFNPSSNINRSESIGSSDVYELRQFNEQEPASSKEDICKMQMEVLKVILSYLCGLIWNMRWIKVVELNEY